MLLRKRIYKPYAAHWAVQSVAASKAPLKLYTCWENEYLTVKSIASNK